MGLQPIGRVVLSFYTMSDFYLSNPGEPNGNQVQSQASDNKDVVLENLRNIKKFFEDHHNSHAEEVLRWAFWDFSMPDELFGKEVEFLPFYIEDLENLINSLCISDPEEEFDDEERDCSEGQFLMRKILVAASIEKTIQELQSVIDDCGYGESYIVDSLGNGHGYHCHDAVDAIQSIIDDINAGRL